MPDSAYTSDDVIRVFEQATGDRLRAKILPSGNTILGFWLRSRADGPLEWGFLPPQMKEQYGGFSIWVCADPWFREDRLSRARRDRQGIYWRSEVPERGPGAYETHWTALKPYGLNVLLEWPAEASRKKTNEQWERLVDALRPLEDLG
ncbi:MAG: hypothetical protein ICV64_06650 [Thermoleophilia bacterium]|nr:hypothetical protein [Thermoleophilia bacterium]